MPFYEIKQDWAPFFPDFQILPRFSRIWLDFQQMKTFRGGALAPRLLHYWLAQNFWHSSQGRSQDFSKGGAEVMEAKALKKKNCLW